MIYTRSNLIGFAFAAIALLFGWLIGNSYAYMFHIKTHIPAYAAQCLLAVVLDVGYRIKKNEEGVLWALINPMKGGHVSYIPIWVFGVVFSATVFVPWYGERKSWGGNVASAQPKILQSTPLNAPAEQPATSAQPDQTSSASQLASTPTPTPTGPPQLRSIMWIPTRPSAQLDKSFAFEGDTVRGYKVTKISRESVDLLTPEGAGLKLVLAAQGAGSSARNVE